MLKIFGEGGHEEMEGGGAGRNGERDEEREEL